MMRSSCCWKIGKEDGRIMKKILSVCLVLIMVLSLTGGGSNPAVEIMKNAQDQTAAIENFEAETVISMAVRIGGIENAVKMTTNAVIFTNPKKMKICMSDGAESTEMLVLQEDDASHVYIRESGEWVEWTLSNTRLSQLDAQQNMAFYLNLVDESVTFSKVAEEILNGQETYYFDMEVPPEISRKIFQMADMEEQLAAMRDLSRVRGDLSSNIGSLTIRMWYDKTTGYPLQYEIDMTDIMRAMYEQMFQAMIEWRGWAPEDLEISLTECILTMTYSNYNSAEDFELPVVAE